MKKILSIALVVVLLAGIAISGTMAYLTDTDSAVNVMTLGNVKINQIEQERDEQGNLVTFTQDKPLYPYVGTLGWKNTDTDNGAYRSFTMENVVDKIVSVKNVGKSDAYVRTVFAFEMGEYGSIDEWYYKVIGTSNNSVDGAEFPDLDWAWSDFVVVVIDGHNYAVRTATHEEALAAGESTIPSLLQVYMNENCGNEEVTKVDGNGNGKYDILVVSQAVQTAGFDNADEALEAAFPMGENHANVPGWFSGMENNAGSGVKTAEELAEAVANGESAFLMNDIKMTETITVSVDAIIDLNGKNLDASANESRPFEIKDGASLTIDAEGAEIDCGKFGLVNMTEGTLTINGGTFTNEQGNNGAFIKVNGDKEMVINLNDVNYTAGTSDSGVLRSFGENVTVNINGGSYEAGMGFIATKATIKNAEITATNTANMWPAVYAAGSDVTIEGCTIKSNCHAIAVAGGETVTVKNCNVTVPEGKLAFQVFSSGGTIDVYECTYTGTYGTTGKMNSGCVAIINIDGVEMYRKG